MLRRHSASTTVAIALTAVTLLVSGCGGADDAGAKSGSGPSTSFDIPKAELVDKTGEATVTISAVDNTLEPQYVEITAGTRVIFKNDGRNAHDIVPDIDNSFAGVGQAEFPPGSSHLVVFDAPGDYPYFCSVHGTMKHGMNGAIRVVGKRS